MRAARLLSVTLALAACSPMSLRAPSATPAASSTPAATPTDTPTPSPTPLTCPTQPGTIVTAELEDPALARSLPYRIYLPPCYAERLDQRYPTIYLLHGLAATDNQWDELGVDEVATSLIQAGEIPPLLIVMPWERKGLDYLTAIPEVLVPAIDAVYRTVTAPESRAIGGLSRGGGWALRIGLQHPAVFAAIGLHSPAVLTPDLYYVPRWLEAIPAADQPRLWIDIGDRDPLLSSVRELETILVEEAFPFTWTLHPGRHEPAYWAENLEDYLRWYAEPWGAPGGPS